MRRHSHETSYLEQHTSKQPARWNRGLPAQWSAVLIAFVVASCSSGADEDDMSNPIAMAGVGGATGGVGGASGVGGATGGVGGSTGGVGGTSGGMGGAAGVVTGGASGAAGMVGGMAGMDIPDGGST